MYLEDHIVLLCAEFCRPTSAFIALKRWNPIPIIILKRIKDNVRISEDYTGHPHSEWGCLEMSSLAHSTQTTGVSMTMVTWIRHKLLEHM